MKRLYQYLESIPGSRKKVFWLVLLSTMVIPVLVNILFTSQTLRAFLDNQLFLFGLGVVVYAAWLALLQYFKKRDNLKWKHLSLTKQEIRKGLYFGLGVYFIVNAVLIAKVMAKGGSLVLTKEFSDSTEFIVALGLFVFNIFLGAFIEEVINRVYLIPQVYQLLVGKIKHKFAALSVAVLLTQVLFAVIHLPADIFRFNVNYNALVVRQEELFLSGIMYALVYLRTRNVVFLALYHAFLNYKFPIIQTDVYLTTLFNFVVLFVLIFWNKIMKTREATSDLKPLLVA